MIPRAPIGLLIILAMLLMFVFYPGENRFEFAVGLVVGGALLAIWALSAEPDPLAEVPPHYARRWIYAAHREHGGVSGLYGAYPIELCAEAECEEGAIRLAMIEAWEKAR